MRASKELIIRKQAATVAAAGTVSVVSPESTLEVINHCRTEDAARSINGQSFP